MNRRTGVAPVALGVARWVVVALAATCLLAACGCSRAFYRRQADAEAYQLVAEKVHPAWDIGPYTVNVRPDSRMYDPFNPDRPPMPLDDPAAHRLMHCVDGKEGWPLWHRQGDTNYRDNPLWKATLPCDEQGQITLSADDAVRAALLHSRNYQAELEELYLSALDVSFERFRFDTQFFAGYQTVYTADGPDRPGGGGESRSTLLAATAPAASGGFRAERLLTTGGELVVGFANSLVWEFSGPNTQSGRTLLDFSLVQPLLRQAGRSRVMERLTLAERTLLYNVRAMERYRQEFFVSVTTGRGLGSGPSRRGGVFGGAGFESFSGLGGGFGNVATTTGGANAGGTGAADAGGYLGLLQDQLIIRNQEQNIAELRDNLARSQEFQANSGHPLVNEEATAFLERGLREQLQVAQAQQALYDSRSRLLNARNAYEATLDGFKQTLGLPPDVCIVVKDPILSAFEELNAPQTQQIGLLVQDLGARAKAIAAAIAQRVQAERNPQGILLRERLAWSEELDRELAELEKILDEAMTHRDRLQSRVLGVATQDIAAFKQARPNRLLQLQRLREKYSRKEFDPCLLLPGFAVDPEVMNLERLRDLDARLEGDLQRNAEELKTFDDRFAEIQQGLKELRAQGAALAPEELLKRVSKQAGENLPSFLTDLRLRARAIQLIQAQARTESIELPPVDITPVQAMNIARCRRLDWMNARAAVVDSWRLIQFNAKDLQSGLNVIFNGDVTNLDDSPFRLKSTTGRLQVGLQFDAPLTRLAERNAYRQSLIEYQQARRGYYAYVDSVNRGLRSILRTIEANKINFEYRRYALGVAARQIILNDAILNARQGQSSGATATRDAVSALSDLLNAQNDFLGVWVNYEVLRRSLDLDLGTIQLTPDGLWLDPGGIDGARLAQFCEDEFGVDGQDLPPGVLPEGPLGAAPLPEEIDAPAAAAPSPAALPAPLPDDLNPPVQGPAPR